MKKSLYSFSVDCVRVSNTGLKIVYKDVFRCQCIVWDKPWPKASDLYHTFMRCHNPYYPNLWICTSVR
jgi:hypothetical protein